MGVPVDTRHHVNMILASSPNFRGITDLMAGQCLFQATDACAFPAASVLVKSNWCMLLATT